MFLNSFEWLFCFAVPLFQQKFTEVAYNIFVPQPIIATHYNPMTSI